MRRAARARMPTRSVLLDVEVIRREVRSRATMAWIDLWEAQERARLLALVATGTADYPDDLSGSIGKLEQRLADHPALHRDRSEGTAAALHVQHEERLRWPTVIPQLTVNQFDRTLPGPDVIVGLSFDLPVLSLRGRAIARARASGCGRCGSRSCPR